MLRQRQMKIHQLNIGHPKLHRDYNNKEFYSAVAKEPTLEPVWLSYTGLNGDSSYEDCHGGHNMALHLYCLEHYAFFNQRAAAPLPVPTFGENLTVIGLLEKDVRVGDIYQVGEATIQISQPTERCGTMGKRIGEPKLLKWIHEEMMTGYYARVLTEGFIAQNSVITLVERGKEHMTIARLNHLLFKQPNQSEMEQCWQENTLSSEWIDRAKQLYSRLERK